MKCQGEFVFKSLNKRDGGEFTNDKGQKINYEPSYVLKVDEETSSGIMERKLKFPESNKTLLNQLQGLSAYTKIYLEFDVILYNSMCKVVPMKLVED